MNHKPRPGGIIYGAVSVILCSGITIGGFRWAVSETQEPEIPVPAITAPVLAIPAAEEPAIGTADLWSNDRSRIDAPLLDVPLEAETQWAIFEQCGQDAELFCAVMAIATVESGFDSQTVGDDGDSIGMMQINTRWNTDRMERLGVTDLTDPVQSAMVAVDLLRELAGTFDSGISDTPTLMAYNMGPTGARRAIDAGTYETTYTQEVTAMFQTYLQEMEGSHD